MLLQKILFTTASVSLKNLYFFKNKNQAVYFYFQTICLSCSPAMWSLRKTNNNNQDNINSLY